MHPCTIVGAHLHVYQWGMKVVTSDYALSLYADDNLLFYEIIELSDYARVNACLVP